jgi:hypothetical protein
LCAAGCLRFYRDKGNIGVIGGVLHLCVNSLLYLKTSR